MMTTIVFAASSVTSNETKPATKTSTVNNSVTQQYNTAISNSGGPAATIQNTIKIMQLMYGNKIYSQNRDELSKEALEISGHDEASLTAFNEELQQEVQAAAVNNSAVGISNAADQVKCFIARDIPFQYECEKTGLIYGGGLDETGREALSKCKNDCYDQSPCYNDSSKAEASVKELANFSDDSFDFTDANLSYSKEYTLNSQENIKYVDLNVTLETKDGEPVLDDKMIFVNIYTIAADGTEILMLKKSYYNNRTKYGKFYINTKLKGIKFEFYNEENDGVVARINIKAYYDGEQRWFCPSLQDINIVKDNAFSKKCPDGTINWFTGNGHSAQICSTGLIRGDNDDGSFSTEKKCLSVCREGYQCRAVQNISSTRQLENFREGCIQGEVGCGNDDCRDLRISGAPIISEVVFDAEMNPTVTISNGMQTAGVIRPRLTTDETLDFEKKNIEEWKDAAYANMVKLNTYAVSKVTIGENTDKSFAYGIGTGHNGEHQLVWKVKPSSFDVNGATQYMYAVIEVDIEYWTYDENAERVIKRDKIYYIKRSKNSDDLVPFLRYKDYGIVTLNDSGIPYVAKNEYSSPKFQNFSGTAWVSRSSSETAPYFKTTNFKDIKFFAQEPVINDLSSYNYSLPGLIRRKTTNGPVETLYYTGDFDGTGNSVAKTAVHVFYSTNKLTYQEVFDKIQNEDPDGIIDYDNFVKIYDTGFDRKSIHRLKSDSEETQDGHIDIYRYGAPDKTRLFFTISPKPEFVGQKGFIYVFLY